MVSSDRGVTNMVSTEPTSLGAIAPREREANETKATYMHVHPRSRASQSIVEIHTS